MQQSTNLYAAHAPKDVRWIDSSGAALTRAHTHTHSRRVKGRAQQRRGLLTLAPPLRPCPQSSPAHRPIQIISRWRPAPLSAPQTRPPWLIKFCATLNLSPAVNDLGNTLVS